MPKDVDGNISQNVSFCFFRRETGLTIAACLEAVGSVLLLIYGIVLVCDSETKGICAVVLIVFSALDVVVVIFLIFGIAMVSRAVPASLILLHSSAYITKKTYFFSAKVSSLWGSVGLLWVCFTVLVLIPILLPMCLLLAPISK